MSKPARLIGRQEEMRKLDEVMASGQAEFVAVYGRRRVGKTFLVRQHLKSRIVFDLTGTKDGSKEQQLQHFFEEYTRRAGKKAGKKAPVSWFEAFNYLAEHLTGLRPANEKKVVFIDEMPWLDTPKSNFVSALEYFWNQYVSAMDSVVLIACGSASSWIKKKLINARGGLYNRVTQRLKLGPFNLHDTAAFLAYRGIKLTHTR